MIETSIAAPPVPDLAAQDRLFADSLRPLATNVEAMLEQAKDARRIYQQGGKLSSWQHKIVNHAAFYELRAVVWADRAALAAEIKDLTGMTYNALDKAQCPWNAHGPTEKTAVFRWLTERLAKDNARIRRTATETKASAARELEEASTKLRRSKAKAELDEIAVTKARDQLRAEANDAARKTVTELIGTLRRALIDELPPILAADTQGKDASTTESIIRARVEAALAAAVA